MQRSSPSSWSQGSASVLLQAAMQRPCPSSQAQAPALLQAAMQPPSSSSQASASALGRPHVDHRLLDLGPTALCTPHRRLAVVSVCLILNLPTPATESMEGHAPWETLNPLSHEAPGIDFSTAYSVNDEKFLHRSNFSKAVPDSFDIMQQDAIHSLFFKIKEPPAFANQTFSFMKAATAEF
uniref:Uncharacterized protein n=1 Tax=Oryza barthii TaxID=65489 RepID=A0A0D3G0M1_9ORYZ